MDRHPDHMDHRKTALIKLLIMDRHVLMAVSDIDATLKLLDDLDGPEPSLSYRLFAKRAAILAEKASEWASFLLTYTTDMNQPVPVKTMERFAEDIQGILDIIKRDARLNEQKK